MIRLLYAATRPHRCSRGSSRCHRQGHRKERNLLRQRRSRPAYRPHETLSHRLSPSRSTSVTRDQGIFSKTATSRSFARRNPTCWSRSGTFISILFRARMVENLDGLDSPLLRSLCHNGGATREIGRIATMSFGSLAKEPRQPACFIEHSLKKAFRKVAEETILPREAASVRRSNKGWRPARGSDHLKGDEHILGSSEFVLEVLRTTA